MVTVPNDFICERIPAGSLADDDRKSPYWIRDEKEVIYRQYPLRGADPKTFRYYLGGYGKDDRACFLANVRLKGADSSSFRALNLAYAADHQRVWTFGGEVKNVDRSTFEVCDSGACRGSPLLIPTGYARDQERVYYYNYDGKTNVVKHALPETFVSFDGQFGADAERVFFEIWQLPKASPVTWRRLDGLYSVDRTRVYYGNRPIQDCDSASFRVVDGEGPQLAMDDRCHYICGKPSSKEEFDKRVSHTADLRRRFPRT